MRLQKILDQDQTPVFTVISLLTTVSVEIVMIIAPFLSSGGWAALNSLALTLFAVAIGLAVNIFSGVAAVTRGEYWGGRIAATGIALWIVTKLGLGILR